MRLTSMGGRRLWCSNSNSSMLPITGSMGKVWPMLWWDWWAFTQVTPSSTLTSLLVWDSSHSSPGASSWAETWRQLSSTSVKYTTRWWLGVTFVRHLQAWLHKAFKTTGPCAKGSVTKSAQSMMPLKCTERLRSPKTQKRNQSLTNWKNHPSQNYAEQKSAWCLPPFLLTPFLNDSTFFSQMVTIAGYFSASPHQVCQECLTKRDYMFRLLFFHDHVLLTDWVLVFMTFICLTIHQESIPNPRRLEYQTPGTTEPWQCWQDLWSLIRAYPINHEAVMNDSTFFS